MNIEELQQQNESLTNEATKLNKELFELKNSIAQGQYRQELSHADTQKKNDTPTAVRKIANGLSKLRQQ